MTHLPYRHGSNLCSASCPIKHIDTAVTNEIKEPAKSWPDIRGLHSLNYSRDAWLTGDAIEVSIATYCGGLPQALQDKVGLGTPGVHPNFWRRATSRDEMKRLIKSRAKRALDMIRATEYSIFPVCTDDSHWVLVVIHKDQRPSSADRTKMEWSHVAQIAVLDPFRESALMKMVCTRLGMWLRGAGGFTVAPDCEKTVWVPLQKDGTSCGPRAYWNAKQILDRLLDLHESDMSYHPSLWDDLSGWFNTDFVRLEMAGRCASAAVREMDYKARVAVECVDRVRKTDGSEAKWEDAGQVMRPANYKNKKPERRPRPRPRKPWQAPSGAGMHLEPSPDTTPDVELVAEPSPVPFPNRHSPVKVKPDARPPTKRHAARVDSQNALLPRGTKRPLRSRSPSPIRIPPPRRTRGGADPSSQAKARQIPGLTLVSRGPEPELEPDPMEAPRSVPTYPIRSTIHPRHEYHNENDDAEYEVVEEEDEEEEEQQQQQPRPVPTSRPRASPAGLFAKVWETWGPNQNQARADRPARTDGRRSTTTAPRTSRPTPSRLTLAEVGSKRIASAHGMVRDPKGKR